MPAEPPATVEPNQPDPHSDQSAATDNPSRISRLLNLISALIDYGTQLVGTLQQRTAATGLIDIARPFGTLDVAEILTRITRGLQRAAALQAWLAGRRSTQPATRTTASPRQSRTARPTHAHASRGASPADTGPASPPKPEDIAAEIRRRPIGAVIADICRDLGILPSNPLWHEICPAIIGNGGNLARLFNETRKRLSTWLLNPPAPALQAGPPSPVTPGTGPP